MTFKMSAFSLHGSVGNCHVARLQPPKKALHSSSQVRAAAAAAGTSQEAKASSLFFLPPHFLCFIFLTFSVSIRPAIGEQPTNHLEEKEQEEEEEN